MSLFSTILSKLGFAKEAVAQPLTQPAAAGAAPAPTAAPAAVSQVDVVAKLEGWPRPTRRNSTGRCPLST